MYLGQDYSAVGTAITAQIEQIKRERDQARADATSAAASAASATAQANAVKADMEAKLGPLENAVKAIAKALGLTV